MKTPEEYLSMNSIQSDKVMADDLSAALRSMCQTFNQSVKFHGIHAGELKHEFLRPRGEAVNRKSNALGPMEERMTDTVPINENQHLTSSKRGDTSGFNVEGQATVSMTNRPLRAESVCSANSILSKRTGESQVNSHERKKTSARTSRQILTSRRSGFLSHSKAVAYIPGRDKSERLRKGPSARPHSSMARTAGITKPALPNKRKIGRISESKSEGHNNAEKEVEKEKLVLKIPADAHMATDLRAYSQWPGMLLNLAYLLHLI